MELTLDDFGPDATFPLSEAAGLLHVEEKRLLLWLVNKPGGVAPLIAKVGRNRLELDPATEEGCNCLSSLTSAFLTHYSPPDQPGVMLPVARSNLFVARQDLLAFQAAMAARVAPPPAHQVAEPSPTKPPASAPDRQPKNTGRPKTQLRRGVEALYLEKLAAGQTDILLPGNVDMFLTELRRIVSGNDEVSDKISEHIRKVSKPSGQWVVHVQDPPDTGGKFIKKNEKPDGYKITAVGKILSDLRKEYPVE